MKNKIERYLENLKEQGKDQIIRFFLNCEVVGKDLDTNYNYVKTLHIIRKQVNEFNRMYPEGA